MNNYQFFGKHKVNGKDVFIKNGKYYYCNGNKFVEMVILSEEQKNILRLLHHPTTRISVVPMNPGHRGIIEQEGDKCERCEGEIQDKVCCNMLCSLYYPMTVEEYLMSKRNPEPTYK